MHNLDRESIHLTHLHLLGVSLTMLEPYKIINMWNGQPRKENPIPLSSILLVAQMDQKLRQWKTKMLLSMQKKSI